MRGDELEGLALLLREGSAQGFMPAHQLLEAALQRRDVERPVHAHEGGHVVGGAAGLELIDEPQALLGEGERQRPGARHGDDGGGLGPGRGLDARGEGGHGGRLEEDSQRQLHSEPGADAGDDLRGQQRVSTQLEEVVGDAHLGQAQDGGEQLRELLLHRVARSGEGRVAAQALRVGRGEEVSRQLAAGRQRQGLQHDEGGGHHVLGQPLLEEAAQALRVHFARGDDVGHQALVAAHFTHHGRGVAHVGGGAQDGLHLAQFHAVAAQLHLAVQAAEEVHRAVRLPLRRVAGAVQARAGLGAERVGHEGLRRHVRAVQVAMRQVRAADEQLPRHSHRAGLAVRVQHVELRVLQRRTDARQLRPRGREALQPVRGDDVRLRRAVLVLQHAPGQRLEEGHQGRRHLELLTRRHHLDERARQRGAVRDGVRHGLERHEGKEQSFHRVLIHELQQRGDVLAQAAGGQQQRAAGPPRGEQLLEGHVEAE